MLKSMWNWYNSLSMTTILSTGILAWMTLSVVLLNSWFLVVYVAAHCLTTGLFVAAIIKRMPKTSSNQKQNSLKYVAKTVEEPQAQSAKRAIA